MVDSENLRLEFSSRLHKALDEAGVRSYGRATDIAREISVRVDKISPMAAGRWLKGETIPHTLHLRALAKWLGVRAEWLEYGAPPMRGKAVIETLVAGPLTLKLTARLSDLERRGKLSKSLVRALNAVLDAAASTDEATG
jgi:hypothetical protein